MHTASYYDPHFTHGCGFKGVLRWHRPPRARRIASTAEPEHLSAAVPAQQGWIRKQPAIAKKSTKRKKRMAEVSAAMRVAAPASKMKARKRAF